MKIIVALLPTLTATAFSGGKAKAVVMRLDADAIPDAGADELNAGKLGLLSAPDK